jgi:hypothetical protein
VVVLMMSVPAPVPIVLSVPEVPLPEESSPLTLWRLMPAPLPLQLASTPSAPKIHPSLRNRFQHKVSMRDTLAAQLHAINVGDRFLNML